VKALALKSWVVKRRRAGAWRTITTLVESASEQPVFDRDYGLAQTGCAMVVISSAIKGIPLELLEAARIDGATEVQAFFKITIPYIKGTLITVITTIVIFSLKLFDIVRVMTGGNNGTNVIANEFYLQRFTYGNTGRASAIAIVLLIAVIPVINMREFSRDGGVLIAAVITSNTLKPRDKRVLHLICFFWLLPTLGVFITSLRNSQDIFTSGWWTVLPHKEKIQSGEIVLMLQ
jgi:ABC-type glycerol-3-phosphate transport system permease component